MTGAPGTANGPEAVPRGNIGSPVPEASGDMTKRLEKLNGILFRITNLCLEPAIVLLALVVAIAQGYELSTKSETISLAICLGVLALASFALNWARVPADLCTLALREKAYRAGLDAMVGSLLFVVAIGWAWLSMYTPPSVYLVLFAIHLIFVMLAVLTSCSAMIRIIRCFHQVEV